MSDSSDSRKCEDELLVFLWETQERGEALDRAALMTVSCQRFHLSVESAGRIVDEFLQLVEFSGNYAAVERPECETVSLNSFMHYEVEASGPYRRGGLASVHAAFDKRFERPVAVKVPLRRFTGDEEVCKRILREARLSARLQHPNIVPIYDFGDYEPAGCPYFVMKFVEGITLLKAIQQQSNDPASMLRLLRVVRDVVGALEHAHSRGIIHRDIKPENVMIGAFHETHLIDLGCAEETANLADGASPRSRAIERFSQTAHSGIFGTFAYMSPEQAKGQLRHQSPKSDVFGIGGLLCHVLTGQPVFTGELEAIVTKAKKCDTAGAHQRLSEARIPSQLRELTLRCLARDPQDRPTATAVGEALDRYFDSVAQESVRNERRAKIAVAALAAMFVAVVMCLVLLGSYRQYLLDGREEPLNWAASERWALARLDEVNAERETLAEELHQIPLEGEFPAQLELAKLQTKLDQVLELTQPLTAYPAVGERSEWLRQQLAIDRERAESDRAQREAAQRDRTAAMRLLAELDAIALCDEQAMFHQMLGAVTPLAPAHALTRYDRALRLAGIELDGDTPADWQKALERFDAQQRSDLAVHVERMMHYAKTANDCPMLEWLNALASRLEPDPQRTEWRRILLLKPNEQQTAFETMDSRGIEAQTSAQRILAAQIAASLRRWKDFRPLVQSIGSTGRPASDAELTISAALALTYAEEAGAGLQAQRLLKQLGTRGVDVAYPVAVAAMLEGNWDDADRELCRHEQLNGADACSQRLRAWIDAHSGREQTALAALGRLHEHPGRSQTEFNGVAELMTLLALDRFDQSEVCFAAYCKQATRPELVSLLEAELAMATGRQSDAERLARQLVAAQPEWAAPRSLLARVLLATGKPQKAAEAIEDALRSKVVSRTLLETGALAADQQGDRLAARDYLLAAQLAGFTGQRHSAVAASILSRDARPEVAAVGCELANKAPLSADPQPD